MIRSWRIRIKKKLITIHGSIGRYRDPNILIIRKRRRSIARLGGIRLFRRLRIKFWRRIIVPLRSRSPLIEIQRVIRVVIWVRGLYSIDQFLMSNGPDSLGALRKDKAGILMNHRSVRTKKVLRNISGNIWCPSSLRLKLPSNYHNK